MCDLTRHIDGEGADLMECENLHFDCFKAGPPHSRRREHLLDARIGP